MRVATALALRNGDREKLARIALSRAAEGLPEKATHDDIPNAAAQDAS